MRRTKEQRAGYKAAWWAANKDRIKAYQAANKDKIAARKAAYYRANKTKLAAQHAAYYADHREELKARQIIYGAGHKTEKAEQRKKRQYGLSAEQFNAMRDRQGGRCLICGCVPEKTLHIDHNHGTGAVRGLLCGKCNVGLGLFGDNPTRLERAAAYLSQYAAAEDLNNQAAAELATETEAEALEAEAVTV